MSSTAKSRVKARIVLRVVQAANNRDVLTCRRLLDTGTSLNDMARPLLNAVANGLEVAVETLLDLGCDVNEKGGFKDISFEIHSIESGFLMSCLHIAVVNEDLKIIKRLLDAGCDANAVDHYSLTPLHWACRYGNAKVVEWLIKYAKNMDINRQSAEGLCALHTAVQYNHTDVVKLLIKAGKSIADQIRLSVPENLRCTRHFACVVRNNMGVEGCIYEPPKKVVPETTSSMLSMAIANSNIDVFRLLMKAGAFKIMNKADKMELSRAVVKCENEEFLLDILRAECAADTNDVFIRDQILRLAIMYDNKTIVEILHRFGANFNVYGSDGMLPIHLASTASPRVLEYLLKNGVDINARTIGLSNSSKTALIYASSCFNQRIDTGEMRLELLKMLISGGAKLNLVDRHGRSALFNAVLAYFEFLFGKLEKIEKQDVVSVSTDMICLLLMEGATVPSLQFWECVVKVHPMYMAVAKTDIHLTNLLIAAGGQLTTTMLQTIQEIVQIQRKSFLDSVGVTVASPRSLKSVCRLAIRKRLLLESGGRAIGNRIRALRLPEVLERYLLLDNEISQFKLSVKIACGMN